MSRLGRRRAPKPDRREISPYDIILASFLGALLSDVARSKITARQLDRRRARAAQLASRTVERNNTFALSAKGSFETPASKSGRARAISALQTDLARRSSEGQFAEVNTITERWLAEFQNDAPEDELSTLQLALFRFMSIQLIGDLHSGEYMLWDIRVRILEILNDLETSSANQARIDDYERALEIAGWANHLLAIFYVQLDMLRPAEAFANEALAHHDKANGPIAKSHTLRTLAEISQRKGEPDTAQALLNAALDCIQSVADYESLYDYPYLAADMAIVEDNLGNYELAEQLITQAIAAARRTSFFSSAAAYASEKRAIILLRNGSPRAAEIQTRQLIGLHDDRTELLQKASSRNRYLLAEILCASGRVAEAGNHLRAAISDDLNHAMELEIGSEEDRFLRAMTRTHRVDLAASIAAIDGTNGKSVRSVVRLIANYKDAAADVGDTVRRAELETDSKSINRQRSEVGTLRRRLKAALLKRTDEDVGELIDQVIRSEQILRLLVRKHQEREASTDAAKSASVQIALPDKLKQRIPPGAVLVDYVQYEHCVQWPWLSHSRETRYLALLWRFDAKDPVAVPLGSAATIDEVIESLNEVDDRACAGAATESISDELADEQYRAATRVREAIFDPIADQIGELTRLIIVPDNAIATVAFGRLPVLSGHLVDDYCFSYLSSSRDLLSNPDNCATLNDPVVIADPDYDLGHIVTGGAEAFRRLKGAREEGQQIAALLGVEPVLGADATLSRVRAVHSPAILHIATHGWFLGDSRESGPDPAWADHERFAGRRNEFRALRGWSVRTGLVLAGFNAAWHGQQLAEPDDDGLLTAGEVVDLDLQNTELVVMSACDTGRGNVLSMQGVYGLRRAFQSAGARSVVASLWKVPDSATRIFMGEFYLQLLRGIGRAAAFSMAQRSVRKQYPNPVYWAGFVLHGDGTPLPPLLLNRLRAASREPVSDTNPAQLCDIMYFAEALRGGDTEIARTRLIEQVAQGNSLAGAALTFRALTVGDIELPLEWLHAQWDNDDDPVADFLRGLYFAASDNNSAAMICLRRSLDKGLCAAAEPLARLCLDSGQPREAEVALQLAGRHGSARALLLLGDLATMNGDTDQAAIYHDAAAALGSATAAHHLSRSADGVGDSDGAAVWRQRAANLGHVDHAMDFALDAFENGDITEALRFSRICGEQWAPAAHNAATALSIAGAPGAQIWWHRAAMRGHPVAAWNLGLAAEARGDVDYAIELWLQAAEGDTGYPILPKSFIAIARILIDRGALDEAERWLLKAVNSGSEVDDGSMAEANVWRAEVHLRWGLPDAANQLMTAAAKGKHPVALMHLAADAEAAGSQSATDLLVQAVNAGSPWAMLYLANLYVIDGNWDKAEPLLTTVARGYWKRKPTLVASMPGGDEQATAAELLALSRLRAGDEPGARTALGLAAPHAESSRRLLAVLDADGERLARLAAMGRAEPMMDLHRVAQITGDTEAAHRWLRLAASAGDHDARLMIGEQALDAGSDLQVEGWLTHEARLGSSDAAELLSRLYGANGKSSLCQSWRQTGERLAKAQDIAQSGKRAYDAGDFDEAEAKWRESADAGSQRAAALLANLYAERHQPEELKQLLIRYARTHSAMALGLSTICRRDGRLAEASQWHIVAERLVDGR